MNIYIHRSGRSYGPYTPGQVRQMLADGSVLEDDLSSFEEGEQKTVSLLLGESESVSVSREPATPMTVTAADLVDNQPSPRIWNPNHADLVAGLLCVFAGGLFSVISPVIHALNWHRLGRRDEALKSWGWVGVFVAVLLILVFTSPRNFDYRPGYPNWVMFGLMLVWHFAHGRSQARFVRSLPGGAVPFRSTAPLAVGSIVAVAALAVLVVIPLVTSETMERSVKDLINDSLRSSMGEHALECVEVRMGNRIATGLHEASAILDNGMSISLTVRELEDDQISVRISPDTLQALLHTW